MNALTRRQMLATASALTATATTLSAALPEQKTEAKEHHWTEGEKQDRQRVISSGMTEAEADAWELLVRAGAAIFALPQQHASTNAEIAQAIHVMQDKLLARPTYRKYLELARAQGK